MIPAQLIFGCFWWKQTQKHRPSHLPVLSSIRHESQHVNMIISAFWCSLMIRPHRTCVSSLADTVLLLKTFYLNGVRWLPSLHLPTVFNYRQKCCNTCRNTLNMISHACVNPAVQTTKQTEVWFVLLGKIMLKLLHFHLLWDRFL